MVQDDGLSEFRRWVQLYWRFSMTIGWGVIGLGKHVKRFIVPALKEAENTKLVAVCSRSMERAQSFAAEHGAARAYDSLTEMLKNPELDVLFVATPNGLHAENTLQAAQAGKHVLCEKPMALTEADCERMIEACDKQKVKLSLDFQNRYHPAHIMARRLIRAGEVGEIRVAKAQICHGYMGGHWQGWRGDVNMAGAAAIMGSGQHSLDLLRFLLDREVEEVRALCIPPGDLDDQNFVILSFEGGIYATSISGVMAPRSDNDTVLYGTKAKVTCKGTLGTVVQGEILIEGDGINIRSSFPVDNPITGNYVRLIDAFNKTIEEDREPDIPAQNGLQMVRITNAILESSKQGRAIKLRK